MRGALADPVWIVLSALVLGVVVHYFFRIAGKIILVSGIALLYLASTSNVAGFLVKFAEADSRPVQAGIEPQAIVLLPAGIIRKTPEFGGDTVGTLTLHRARLAARLQRQTGLPLMVTGGRARDATAPTSELMRRVLVEDFQAAVTWVESESRNTAEHARNCAPLLEREGIDSIILVTHSVHMPRARLAFERAGLKVKPAGTILTSANYNFTSRGMWPSTYSLYLTWYALHEIVGYFWYRHFETFAAD